MYTKEIKYIDFNGDERTEDYMFHISRSEAQELELSISGGMSAYLRKMIADKNGHAIVQNMKNIILLAVGEKSEDGRRFVKSEEMRNAFYQSAAYDALFEELTTNAEACTDFVNGALCVKN